MLMARIVQLGNLPTNCLSKFPPLAEIQHFALTFLHIMSEGFEEKKLWRQFYDSLLVGVPALTVLVRHGYDYELR